MKTIKLTIMKTKTLSIALMAVTSLFIACSEDDPIGVNEEEVITTVRYELTNTANNNDVVVLTSTDNDGDGPNPPMTTVSGSLTAGATYSGAIEFLNETVSPADNITTEVSDEADEHEVFYIVTGADIMIAKNDTDNNGNPLGLDTTATIGNAGNGTLQIVLRHEPLKPNDGSLTGAGGETDVEVMFNVVVQ